MPYTLRKATDDDIPAILRLMAHGKDTAAHPDWFVADGKDYVRSHIDDAGFTILALSGQNEAVGFFSVDFPGTGQENLGRLLGMADDDLSRVAHMDTAVVQKKARGRHLQRRMLNAAEEALRELPYRYYMATVHPDNRFSLDNMLAAGYRIKATSLCYGGLPRHILIKDRGTP